MLSMREQLHIRDLFQTGHSVSEVIQMTGKSLGTIYKYKKLEGQLQEGEYYRKDGSTEPELSPYKALIDREIKRRKLKLNGVYVKIQKQGYAGSLHLFTDYYNKRKQHLRPRKELKHVEKEPGEQAQVDWAHFGEIIINNKREKVYLFSYILSYSRALYMEFVVRQNQRTLQLCHAHAFEKIGMPKTIVYDNMKTVVNRREKMPDGSKKVIYNLKFLDFASNCGFEPIACHPYYPQEKGKVEASFRYVRKKFVRCTPSMNLTLEELNKNLEKWLEEEAQQRIHGTTGERPHSRWLREKAYLTFPSKTTYQSPPIHDHHTSQYGIITHNGITYQLGVQYARTKIVVREVQKYGLPSLEFYHKNVHIITVPIPTKRHSWVEVFNDLVDSNDARPALKKNVVKDKNHIKIKEPIVIRSREKDYYKIHLR